MSDSIVTLGSSAILLRTAGERGRLTAAIAPHSSSMSAASLFDLLGLAWLKRFFLAAHKAVGSEALASTTPMDSCGLSASILVWGESKHHS